MDPNPPLTSSAAHPSDQSGAESQHVSPLRLITTRSGAQLEPLQVTIEEAAQLLSYSRRTVERLIERGELPSVGSGRMCRVALADLRAYQVRNRRRNDAEE
jgi:excisionase family DNA binding protein